MVKPGDLGLEGNPDYSFLGSPQAGNFENLSTTLTFFGGVLRLSSLFDRKGDVRKNNSTDHFHVGFGGISGQAASFHYAFRESRMTPEQQAGMERRVALGSGIHQNFVFAEDGSFIRWREATLTYAVPSGISELFGASSASITVGGRNLVTWTDYTGLDPETITVGGRSSLPANEEFYGEAQVRRWLTRIQLTF